MVFRSGSFSGYPRKFMNDMRSLISLSTCGSKDGTSATKNHEKHFGYKAHTLVNEIKIIEKLSVTPANVHDSQIDLSIPGIICYRDKGYFGSECKGINGTMDRSVRGHPLSVKSIRRNLRISRIRSAVEHPYAFFKGMFHFFHVMVTTVQRVRVKTYLTAICYNLMRSRYLDRQWMTSHSTIHCTVDASAFRSKISLIPSVWV